jgi:AcrR family transcriptional regulator
LSIAVNDRSGLLPPHFAAEGTRRRILEGAVRLFAAQGFHGSSMRELAKLVELQASALYVHFPSKEHVLAELVRAGHEAHQQGIRVAMLEAGTEPLAQLSALVRVNVRLHATHPHLAIVVNAEMGALSPELAAPGLALRKQSVALLQDVIERGVASGHFAVPHVVVVVAAIGAMGLRIPYWYTPQSMSIDELEEAHVELARRLVGARS